VCVVKTGSARNKGLLPRSLTYRRSLRTNDVETHKTIQQWRSQLE
jgi:hypothetical protein